MKQPKHDAPISESIVTFDQRAAKYLEYVRKVDSKRFTTGLGHIDMITRGVAPGEVMIIIAYSGTFKSALLQNLLMSYAARTKTYQLFFSMEMPMETVFEREIQISSMETGYAVEKEYKSLSQEANKMHKQAVMAGSPFVLVCDKPRLGIDQIRDYINFASVKYEPLGAVGIDYMGLMAAEGKTLFEKSAETSIGLKNLAKEMDVPIIALCQVSRAYAASKAAGIEMDAAKGGGDIEAGADVMIGMYKHDDDLIMRILKARKGQSGANFKVIMDPCYLKFHDAEPWEPPKKEKKSCIF